MCIYIVYIYIYKRLYMPGARKESAFPKPSRDRASLSPGPGAGRASVVSLNMYEGIIIKMIGPLIYVYSHPQSSMEK